MEKALEEEIRRVRFSRFKRLLDEAIEAMDISVEEWAEVVKETRTEK